MTAETGIMHECLKFSVNNDQFILLLKIMENQFVPIQERPGLKKNLVLRIKKINL